MRLRFFTTSLLIGIFLFHFFASNNLLSAQELDFCDNVYRSCPVPCNSESRDGCYLPNFDCVSRRVLDPTINCCIHRCANQELSGEEREEIEEFYRQFNFFGTKVNIRTDNFIGWITLSIQAFLAIISFVALLRGIKIGVIDIPNALDADSRKKASVSIVNTIIGFALAWGTIFIIQFVLSLLGLPGLNELVLFGDISDSARTTIVIN